MSSFLPAFSYSFLACVILFLPFCLFYSSNSFLFILCFPTPLSPSFVLYFSRCHLLQLLSIFLILSICYSLTLVSTLSYTFLAPLLFLSVYLSPSLFPSSRRSFCFSFLFPFRASALPSPPRPPPRPFPRPPPRPPPPVLSPCQAISLSRP